MQTKPKGIDDLMKYPEGKINDDDDGAAYVKIFADHKKDAVVIDFDKPIKWIALEKPYALALANAIKKRAEELKK